MKKAAKSLVVRLAPPFPPSPRLDNVSLQIDLNEHLGVIGKNASGKRSMLKGIHKACVQAGLQVESVDFDTHRNAVRNEGNVTVSRVLGGMRDNTDIIVRFGLTSVWWRRLKSLSTGEFRKVLLARAVAKNPDVLILDRPFDGLDAKSRKSLLMILDEISDSSMSNKQAPRPLVQGIKWQERQPVRIVLATHRPAQELSAKIKSLLICEGENVKNSTRTTNQLFVDMDKKTLAGLVKLHARSRGTGQSSEASATSSPFVSSTQTAGRTAASYSTASASATMLGEPLLDIQRLTVFPVREQTSDILEGKDPLRPLLNRVSWAVHPREVWWLQGENGASKSVLLSCALGPDRLLKMASQQHATRQWEVEPDPEADRRRKRPPTITCTDSVEMVSTELHMSLLESEKRDILIKEYLALKCSDSSHVESVLEDLGLPKDILNRKFAELSIGEQKLILICGAVVARPKLLILDEPCQSLDLEHRRRVALLVDQLCASSRQDIACVFVSHHEDELPRSVTHRLVLDKGTVVSRGHFHIFGY